MLNPKHNAKHDWRTGTSASSTARAVTSYEMIRKKTRSTSSQFLTSLRFPTTTSEKVDATVTATGRKNWITSTSSRINSKKKCKKREFLSIHDRFLRDAWFRKTIIELGRTEEVTRKMGKLANEDRTHYATEEEINVNRSNWWIFTIFVGFDTMPVRYRADFKEALSTLRRLKNQEDQAYYQNWQSSSSSWWNWQDSWWHPSSEYHRDDGPRTDQLGKPAKQ